MSRKTFKDYIDDIKADSLINYYIEENHSQKEVIEKFNISNIDMLHKILLYYNITKPNYLRSEKIKSTLSSKSEDERKNISLKQSIGLKGRSLSEETKRKISESHKGKGVGVKGPQSKETCLKKSISLKDHYSTMSKEEKQSQNGHISNYFKNASLEQLNERKLKKIESLNKKTKDERIDSYIKNLNSRDIKPSPLFLKLRFNKEEAINYLKNNPSTYNDLVSIFNVTYSCLANWLEHNNLNNYLKNEKSNYELQIKNYLDELKVDYLRNTRKIIPPQELDFYIPSKNIAIEFNGNYWHSDINLKDKNYHLNKSKLCEEKGIRLIHIWEYEWNNPKMQTKIKQLLRIALGKVDTKIYARNCDIKQISNKEASILNNNIHLQNHRNAQVTYGLFYKDNLVQLMSFSKSKYNKNLKNDNEWEIIRGCPGSNNIVIGGVSKLFKHFIKDYKPSKIFSYCDFNKFNGISYEKLGMSFVGYTGPDLSYFMGYEVRKRNPSQYKNNKENCVGKIWGAGSKKYIWESKNEVCN